jgi:hypothetical protein
MVGKIKLITISQGEHDDTLGPQKDKPERRAIGGDKEPRPQAQPVDKERQELTTKEGK